MLMFEKDMVEKIKSACNQNIESNAIILAKAVTIGKRDMFEMKYSFSGSFAGKCQDDAVPEKLKAFVCHMILERQI